MQGPRKGDGEGGGRCGWFRKDKRKRDLCVNYRIAYHGSNRTPLSFAAMANPSSPCYFVLLYNKNKNRCLYAGLFSIRFVAIKPAAANRTSYLHSRSKNDKKLFFPATIRSMYDMYNTLRANNATFYHSDLPVEHRKEAE